jgi:hypothetical protein
MRTRALTHLLLWLLLSLPAWAHRTEVDQLTLSEIGGNRYSIRYAAPPPGMSEFAAPILPERCEWVDGEDVSVLETATSLVFESKGGPLTAEDQILLPWGRNGVLVIAQRRDGSTTRQFFLSGAEGIKVEMGQLRVSSASFQAMAKRYIYLGVEHILGGIDHLLFVAGLLLLVKGTRALLLTITAFNELDLELFPLLQREYVVLTARVHPGETTSSWIMKPPGLA